CGAEIRPSEHIVKYSVPAFFFVRFTTERPYWTENHYRRRAHRVLDRRLDEDASRSRRRVRGPSTYSRRCGDDRSDREEAGPEDCGPDQARDQAMDQLSHGEFSFGERFSISRDACAPAAHPRPGPRSHERALDVHERRAQHQRKIPSHAKIPFGLDQ